MRRRAAAVSAETPGDRLPVPPTGDELERLGETLSAMLGRLESALERERDFVADAGHELRTPLALLGTELELALRHAESPEELREAVRVSSAEVDRLTQLAEDLLLIARSDRGRLALNLEPVDPAELLTSVVNRFQWRAEEAERALLPEAQVGAQIRGDRIRLEQALANLVDNALRHRDGRVRLGVVTTIGSVELHVKDEGDRLPARVPRTRLRAFHPASARPRRVWRRARLAIVQAIAEAHGGKAHATTSGDGGADVLLVLPDHVPATANPERREVAPSVSE